MYRLATCFWVSLRTLSPQGLSIAPNKNTFSFLCARLALTLLREVRLRLGSAKGKLFGFPFALRSPCTNFAP